MAEAMLSNTTPIVKTESVEMLIVDVEGFQIMKDFFIKEVAFYNPHNQLYWTGIFLPPFERDSLKKKSKTCIEWATNHRHGLKWEKGQYPYSMTYYVFSHFGKDAQLYAKGREKCAWLQQYSTKPVINLDDFGYPPAKEVPQEYLCSEHNQSTDKFCAVDKAIRLGRYMQTLWDLKRMERFEHDDC